MAYVHVAWQKYTLWSSNSNSRYYSRITRNETRIYTFIITSVKITQKSRRHHQNVSEEKQLNDLGYINKIKYHSVKLKYILSIFNNKKFSLFNKANNKTENTVITVITNAHTCGRIYIHKNRRGQGKEMYPTGRAVTVFSFRARRLFFLDTVLYFLGCL